MPGGMWSSEHSSQELAPFLHMGSRMKLRLVVLVVTDLLTKPFPQHKILIPIQEF